MMVMMMMVVVIMMMMMSTDSIIPSRIYINLAEKETTAVRQTDSNQEKDTRRRERERERERHSHKIRQILQIEPSPPQVNAIIVFLYHSELLQHKRAL